MSYLENKVNKRTESWYVIIFKRPVEVWDTNVPLLGKLCVRTQIYEKHWCVFATVADLLNFVRMTFRNNRPRSVVRELVAVWASLHSLAVVYFTHCVCSGLLFCRGYSSCPFVLRHAPCLTTSLGQGDRRSARCSALVYPLTPKMSVNTTYII